MSKVHRRGQDAETRKATRRPKRPCRSAPSAPANVQVSFGTREAKERQEWRARVTWDAVTTDVASRSISVEAYTVQLRATDASGNPVETDGGDPAVWRVLVDDDTKAVFAPIARPKTWYYQARVRALNRVGGARCWSAWSAWTTPIQPSTGALPGPPVPTGLALNFYDTDPGRDEALHATVSWNEIGAWTPPDGDELDGVTHYIVQLQVSSDGTTGGILRTRRQTVSSRVEDGDTVASADFGHIRSVRWYRARVRALDVYGRKGAFTEWTPFIRPAVTLTAPASVTVSAPVARRIDIEWQPPTSEASAARVDRYRVEVYQGATLKATKYVGRSTLTARYAVPEADAGLPHSATVYAIDEDGNVSSGTSSAAPATETGTLDGSIITPGSAVDVTVRDATADADVIAELSPSALAFEEITVGAVVSESVLSAGQSDLVTYVDPVNGDDDNDGLAPRSLADTFARSTTDGWGTSDSGHVWSLEYGSPADVWTDPTGGGIGVLRVKSEDARKDIVASVGGMHDELLLRFWLGSTPNGSHVNVAALLGWFDANNHYLLEAQVPSGGGEIKLRIRERVDGTATELVTLTATGITFAPGQAYLLRAQAYHTSAGRILRGRMWQDGSAEPDQWTVEHTDTGGGIAEAAGRVGVHADCTGALTSAVQVRVDEVTQQVLNTIGDAVVGSTGPVATLTEALARTPRYLAGNAYIVSAYGVEYDEGALDLHGFLGPGRLYLQGLGAAYGAGGAVLHGTIEVAGCSMHVRIAGWEIQDDGSHDDLTATVRVTAARYIELRDCAVQSNQATTGRSSNVQVRNGSVMRVRACQLDGSAATAISVTDGSVCVARQNQGQPGARSYAYEAAASILFQHGTRPNLSNNTLDGGQIFGSSMTAGGTAPPTSTRVTRRWTATRSGSWRNPPWGSEWRTDNDYVYQGAWGGNGNHKGVWFYPDAVANALAGKTIDAAHITIRRRSEGGASAARDVYVVSTSKSSPTGGEPDVVSGPTRVGSLKWGQTRRFRLPASIAADLASGKNLGLYVADGDPYLICEGVRGWEKSGQLEVTYH